MKTSKPRAQRGVMLLEALIAILIFSLGVLGMVAINARAVQVAADAEYRTDAAKFASDISSQIALSVDRSTPATIAGSLGGFAHMTGGADCAFTGTASGDPVITAWLARLTAARTGLPGVIANGTQILVANTAANFNRVTITLCWQAPSDARARRHTLITYIN